MGYIRHSIVAYLFFVFFTFGFIGQGAEYETYLLAVIFSVVAGIVTGHFTERYGRKLRKWFFRE